MGERDKRKRDDGGLGNPEVQGRDSKTKSNASWALRKEHSRKKNKPYQKEGSRLRGGLWREKVKWVVKNYG